MPPGINGIGAITMEITVKELKKKDIKILTGIFKKIGVENFNFDLKDKEAVGGKVLKLIVDKYDVIDLDLSKFISAVTNITAEQVEDLTLKELYAILKDIWKVNDIIGFLKSGS